MIAAGYEDGNDADTLRRDAMFKLALDRLPSDEELCSQSTISRLENLPDVRALLRLGRALVAQYCGLFRQAPKRILLDIDDTPRLRGGRLFDRVHGGQQLRLFNGFHDGFQPIVVFEPAPAKAGGGGFVRRLVGAIRARWPKVEIPGLRRGRLCKSSSRCSIRTSRHRASASARGGERTMRCSEPGNTSPTGMTLWLISTSKNFSIGSTTMC